MIGTQQYPDSILRQLGQLSGANLRELKRVLRSIRPYHSFTIPKGPGSFRTIEAPSDALKEIQRQLLINLLYRIPIAPCCHGFVQGRSIVTNARIHCNQQILVNYDIAQAFPSVSRQRIRITLERKLGHFLKHQSPRLDSDERDLLIELIADLVSYKECLPQGAPTSGAILNLCLAPLDRRISKAIASWAQSGWPSIRYSRYADDLTLSGGEAGLPPDAEPILRRELHRAGFQFNPQKTRRADIKKGQSLIVCGLQIDGDTIRLPRKRIKQYRSFLHKLFYPEALSDQDKNTLYGIAGLVHMVYGTWPPGLKRPWKLLAARQGLTFLDPDQNNSSSGWSPYH